MSNRNGEKYFQKAAMYDMLSNYYKYTRPDLHVRYYQQHLKNMKRAIEKTRTNPDEREQRFARVRVLHASPDAPNVDIYVNEVRILQNIPYKSLSNYMSLPSGTYQIDIYRTGQMVSAVASKKVTVTSAKLYTVAAIGSVNNLRIVAFEDVPFVPRGETKVRFVHLSPDAPAVDIAIKNGDVVFRNVSFRKATDYLVLTPMAVDFEIRLAGTKEVVLTLHEQRFDPNIPYSIYVVGFVSKTPKLEALRFNP
jgi:hypothetical protein